MLVILQAALLGLIQGLAEFIPISSSAHLVIVPWLFYWTNESLASLPFDVALHFGTLIALLWFFYKDWINLAKAGFMSIIERDIKSDFNRRLAWFIVIGSIPGGVIGFVFEDTINMLFHADKIDSQSMIILGTMMIVMGALLFTADHFAKHKRNLEKVTIKDALLIGTAQAFAIFPGVSRSGSTITVGLALGLTRETAARFSFLLSAPIVLGASLKSILDVKKGFESGSIPQSDLVLFPVGLLIASVSGFLCIKYLLKYLQKHSNNVFVYYRWAVGAIVIAAALIRG